MADATLPQEAVYSKYHKGDEPRRNVDICVPVEPQHEPATDFYFERDEIGEIERKNLYAESPYCRKWSGKQVLNYAAKEKVKHAFVQGKETGMFFSYQVAAEHNSQVD